VIPPNPTRQLEALNSISHGLINPIGDFGFVVFPKVTIHVALPQCIHLRSMAVEHNFTAGTLHNPSAAKVHLSLQNQRAAQRKQGAKPT
jgi:hypothetical protein